MHYMSPELIEKHLSGFQDVEREPANPEPGAEPEEPVIISHHADPASLDALHKDAQRQLAAIVYAGVHDTSIADAETVLARRGARATAASGTRENFQAGLERAKNEMPDWFTEPSVLEQRKQEAAELAAIEEARAQAADADERAMNEFEQAEAARLAEESQMPVANEGPGRPGDGSNGFDNDEVLEEAARQSNEEKKKDPVDEFLKDEDEKEQSQTD